MAVSSLQRVRNSGSGLGAGRRGIDPVTAKTK
jgi:hypothetical protein